MSKPIPSFFGLINSNRDFKQQSTWGKNQFNSSFPAALFCYMSSKNLSAKYIINRDNKIVVDEISFKDAIGLEWNDKNLFFSFESEFSNYHKYVTGKLPRVDLVILSNEKNVQISSFEIKLTAIPDNTTCDLAEEKYGSELVIRPDTIVYLALSLIHNQKLDKKKLNSIITSFISESLDFKSEVEMIINFPKFIDLTNELIKRFEINQNPIIMQPIWKTLGKSPKLAENCLDLFIWSDVAFLKFNLDICKFTKKTKTINRQMRSIIWLVKMLYDYSKDGHFSAETITNEYIYGSRNDKAFAVSGFITNFYMKCPELLKPRIKATEIKNIILGGGEKLLSPERRFDALVFSSTNIFDEINNKD